MATKKAVRFDRKRSRLLDWSQAHAKNSEELLETTRRLGHTVEALETEIIKTENDIRKVHKAYKHSGRKRRSA